MNRLFIFPLWTRVLPNPQHIGSYKNGGWISILQRQNVWFLVVKKHVFFLWKSQILHHSKKALYVTQISSQPPLLQKNFIFNVQKISTKIESRKNSKILKPETTKKNTGRTFSSKSFTELEILGLKKKRCEWKKNPPKTQRASMKYLGTSPNTVTTRILTIF